MGFKIDYKIGEQRGCSSQIVIADRVFYVKHFIKKPSEYFSGDQQGLIQKEISKQEFELWLKVLADGEAEVSKIQKELELGKKY